MPELLHYIQPTKANHSTESVIEAENAARENVCAAGVSGVQRTRVLFLPHLHLYRGLQGGMDSQGGKKDY